MSPTTSTSSLRGALFQVSIDGGSISLRLMRPSPDLQRYVDGDLG